MTGLYSGSPYNEFPEVFHAEGDTEKVTFSERDLCARLPKIGK